MRALRRPAIIAFLLVLATTAACTAQNDSSPIHQLQLLSPGPSGVATYNQKQGARPYSVDIPDTQATVYAGQTTIRGRAEGMRNVAVIVPAGGGWYMTQPGEDGAFAVEVMIPNEVGPLPIEIYAWDSPPNDPNYRVELKARVILFVAGQIRSPRDRATDADQPAAGMRLVWSDEFDAPLSISSAEHRNARWFAGGKPSATGSQYTDALFVGADDPRRPFFLRDGFLRIRATYDATMVDPDKWRRTWWSGHLATGFPDGSASVEFREGYAEVRMMVPAGDGTWPSFWMLDSANTQPNAAYGEVEIDVLEAYGRDPNGYRVTQHKYPGTDPTDKQRAEISQRVALRENPSLFHTYGVKLTRHEVIWYHDSQEVFRAPLFRAKTLSPLYLMLGLGMGGGWPITVPPAGYYDVWIDYVRVYR